MAEHGRRRRDRRVRLEPVPEQRDVRHLADRLGGLPLLVRVGLPGPHLRGGAGSLRLQPLPARRRLLPASRLRRHFLRLRLRSRLQRGHLRRGCVRIKPVSARRHLRGRAARNRPPLLLPLRAGLVGADLQHGL